MSSSLIKQNTTELQAILDKVYNLPNASGGGSDSNYKPLKEIAEGNKFGITAEDLEGVVEIVDCAFDGWRTINSVEIPDSVKKIGVSAFSECGLSQLDLGNGVEEIGALAFRYGLVDGTVIIPHSVKRIERCAFAECAGTTLTFKGKPDFIAEDAFESDGSMVINVPWSEGEVEGAPWSGLFSIIPPTINYNYTE